MEISSNSKITEINLVKNNSMYSIKEIVDLLELQSVIVDSILYSIEDPYILPIDDLGSWSEQIDIKEWIINKIKI
jgi:hypothetical protein